MAQTQRPESRECPHLLPAAPSTARSTVAIYCRRPDGRVRVPRPDETHRFCFGPGWQDCPGVNDHARRD
jgi:hypothetical protein